MKVTRRPVTAEAVQLHETVLFPAMQADPGMWLVIEKGCARIMPDHMFREEYNYRDPAVKMKPITDVVCKYCGGKNIIRKGYRTEKGQSYLRRFCRDCEREFSIPEKQAVTTSTAILTGDEQVSDLIELTPVKQDTAMVIRSMVSSRKDNFNVGAWTQAELDVIGKEPDKHAAIKAHHQSFPLSVRNDNAIQQKWHKLKAKEQPLDKSTIIVPGTNPIVESPLEEKKSFFVGAQVKQVAGRTPHAMGTGDIIEIKANGDIVVEFYHERKTCKRDELAFWKPDHTKTAVRV